MRGVLFLLRGLCPHRQSNRHSRPPPFLLHLLTLVLIPMALSRSSTAETVVNGVSELLSPAISILDNTLRIRHNKSLFSQLARDAGALVYATVQPGTFPPLVHRRLDTFVELLTTIEHFIIHHLAQNYVSRVLTWDVNDKKKIQGFRAQLRKLLKELDPDIFFHMSETIEEVHARLRKLQEQLDRPPPSAPVQTQDDYNKPASSPDPESFSDASSATDVGSSTEHPTLKDKFSPDARLDSKLGPTPTKDAPPLQPVSPATLPPISPPAALAANHLQDARGTFIVGASETINVHNIYLDSASSPSQRPENLEIVVALRRLMLSHRQLIPILGVAISFKGNPSVLQISRVLGLEWTHVADTLQLISPYLDRLDSPIWKNSDVRVPNFIQELLVQRTEAPWIDAQIYHARIAEWCLVGKRVIDARDIVYRTEFWPDHVCGSRPSRDLFVALRASSLPFKPESRVNLARVIYWLEPDGQAQAPDLVDMYRKRLEDPDSEEISIMGGEMKMSLHTPPKSPHVGFRAFPP
ncbi:hypothetical protein C8F04DRAFT_40868 [Mycena alexandri]|uniref:Uncharacterized protein n=1 Tax=Mycena alexandri TaxID=1745969 RepID=A0AAD6SPI9_9AGAR|nr:hypothetical protein C8F04DRAFT_40868 [Mycena alexandri]